MRKWKRYARAVEQDCEAMADRALAAEAKLEGLAQGLERLAENTLEPDARAKQKALYVAADYVRSAQEESE